MGRSSSIPNPIGTIEASSFVPTANGSVLHTNSPPATRSATSPTAAPASRSGGCTTSPPAREEKLERCTRGSIYDVVLDLRADSATCFRWCAVELTQENRRMLYIPAGVAHGFLTIEEHTEVLYQMGANYVPEAARTVRWDDPRFGVEWPHQPALMSDRDRSASNFTGGPLTW